MKQFDAAYRLYQEGKYQVALQAFESVVTAYPEEIAGRQALVFVERTLDKLGRSSEILARLDNASTTYHGKSVAKLAALRRVYEYIKRGRYQDAVAQAGDVVRLNDDTTLVKFSLYDLGSIYWYFLANKETARQYYGQLIARFPNDPLTHSAEATLGESTGPQKPVATTSPSGAAFELQNSPNPFNPATMIRFSVPADGYVSLKVFDVLGREVATLLNEYRAAGTHQVNFNATNLPTGIYFTRLATAGMDLVRKVMLVK